MCKKIEWLLKHYDSHNPMTTFGFCQDKTFMGLVVIVQICYTQAQLSVAYKKCSQWIPMYNLYSA